MKNRLAISTILILSLAACATSGNPTIDSNDVDTGPVEEQVAVPPVNPYGVQFHNFSKCAGIARAVNRREPSDVVVRYQARFTAIASSYAQQAGIPEANAKQIYDAEQREMEKTLQTGKSTLDNAKAAIQICASQVN